MTVVSVNNGCCKCIDLQAVKPGPDEHPLQYTYVFWYSRRTPGKATLQSFDQNLKKIGAFASVCCLKLWHEVYICFICTYKSFGG